MANPTTLEEILNINIDDIEDNVVTPKGTYLVNVKGMPEQGVSSQKQTPFWRFQFAAIEAGPDVERSEINDAGGLQNLKLAHDFYMVDTALPMFRDFLREALGLSGMPVKQAISEAPGRQLKVHVSHRPQTGRDGKVRLRAEIDTFLAA
jgi:hypothetical protein